MMFERFTDQARRVVVMAQEHARLVGPGHIGTEHLVLGLTDDTGTVAGRALGSLSIATANLFEQAVELTGAASGDLSGHIPFTARAKQVLERSLVEAQALGHSFLGTEHILLAILADPDCTAAKMLRSEVGELDRVRAAVEREMGPTSKPSPSASGANVIAPPPTAQSDTCMHPTTSLQSEAAEVPGPTGSTSGHVIRCNYCGTAIGFVSGA